MVAYIARAVIAGDTIVFYRQLRKKQATKQDKILKFPLWPASSFLEVKVWWAVLRNVCASSPNKYEAITSSTKIPGREGKLEEKL